MYVCLCQGITDGHIKEAVENGATTMKALGDELGVSRNCGSCAKHANSVLQQSLQDEAKVKVFFDVA